MTIDDYYSKIIVPNLFFEILFYPGLISFHLNRYELLIKLFYIFIGALVINGTSVVPSLMLLDFYYHKQLHFFMPQHKKIMANIMKLGFYFIFIGALVIDVMSHNPMLTYTVRFRKMYVQPNITIDYYTINRYKEGDFINGEVKIDSKELINKAVAVFSRCDPDGINCEYFQTWTLTGLCDKLKDKNQIWSRWYGSFDPPMVCPLNKVYYQLNNGTINIGMALLLYPQATDYQWRIVQKFYADDIFIGSYTMEVYFFGYRKKTKSIFKP